MQWSNGVKFRPIRYIFEGILTVKSVEERNSLEKQWWVIRDIHGFSLVSYKDRNFIVGETYHVKGRINFVRGGTFLNIQKAEALSYKEEEEIQNNLQDELSYESEFILAKNGQYYFDSRTGEVADARS